MKPLYFDYNATTPVHPRVIKAMRPYLTEDFGNPGCAHMWGLRAKQAMDKGRRQLAGLINAKPGEIVFTSCATEADNLALFGTLKPGDHLVVSAVEHPAILKPAQELESRGVDVSVVPVDQNGLVSPEHVAEALKPNTRLVSVMLANNEVGTIQPVAEIAKVCSGRNVPVHTDAAQAVGKIGVDVKALGVDMLTVAGHKMYAPKGVGALYVREGVRLNPMLFGGGQEHGVRSGTENIAYIVGLGAACALAAEDLANQEAGQRELGEMFLNGLELLGREFIIHGQDAPRLPGTMSVGFRGLRAGDILSGLAANEVGASGGAACHAGEQSVSYVLAAMNAPREYALGTIRFSWGRFTEPQDVTELLHRLGRVFSELR